MKEFNLLEILNKSKIPKLCIENLVKNGISQKEAEAMIEQSIQNAINNNNNILREVKEEAINRASESKKTVE